MFASSGEYLEAVFNAQHPRERTGLFAFAAFETVAYLAATGRNESAVNWN